MKRKFTQSKLKSYLLNKKSFLSAFFVLFFIFCVQAQVVVKGIVKGKDGATIPSVTVKVKGATKGVLTDLNGGYSIQVENLNQTLVFSAINLQEKEIPINGKTEMNVVMEEIAKALDEVVVLAYQTIKRKDMIGANSVAPIEQMQKQTATTVSEALLGRVPGVTVRSSGEPGQTAWITIRGISSIGSDVQPLFVIDGIPTSETKDLNPNDIESVVVLKDASSAAMYGSRASNGVILITTKKGKKGKNKLDFSMKTSIDQVTRKYDLMSTPEWLATMKTKYKNANNTSLPQIWDTTLNQDWQDAITQNGVRSDYNLSASGGTDNLTYMISGGYMSHKGVFVGPGFDRYTARINGSYQKGRVKIEENLALSRSFHTLNDLDLNSIIRMPPVIPVKDTADQYTFGNYNTKGAADNLTNGVNPLAIVAKNHRTNISYRILGNVTGELEIFKWLKYKANVGVEYNPNEYRAETKQIKTATNDANPPGMLYVDKNQSLHKTLENWLTFDKQFGKHTINAMAGYTKEMWNWTSVKNSVDSILRDNSGNYYFTLKNGKTPSINEDFSASALRSILGRVSYNYNDKYYITASIRNDGSSKFAKSGRYGTFPSVSGAWKVSNEKLFKDIEVLTKYVSDLKIRASWGKLGNQAIGDYAYQQMLNVYEPYFIGGTKLFGQLPIQIVDQSLKWETTQSTNIGFDLGLLKNRINIGFDWFNRKSIDLLYSYQFPYVIGSANPSTQRNVGSVQNKGIELTLNYKKMEGDFHYSITVNATHRTSKVLALSQNNAPIYGWGTKTEVGRQMAEFYLVEYDGIYQNTHADSMAIQAVKSNSAYKPRIGDMKFIDANHDSIFDDNDRVYSGSSIPKLEYSINIDLEYKGFDMMIYFYGMQGRKVLNGPKYWLYNVGDGGNYKAGLLNESWTPENQSTTYQKIYYQGTIPFGGGTWQLENGSFLRCKTLQIGYTVKPEWLKKVKIDKARIFVSADNLFTITKYSGLDVDFRNTDYFAPAGDPGGWPNVRTISAGLQFTF